MSAKKLTLANNPLFAGPALKDRVGSPYRDIDVQQIDVDPNQPRKMFDEEKLNDLAGSIARYGVLSPILVRNSKTPGRFDLISGERRLRASIQAGRSTIPAVIYGNVEVEGDDTRMAVQLAENIQRADLHPLERAQSFAALQDAFGLSIRDIAERVGVSKSMVQRSLELLSLPDDLLNALKQGVSESKVLLLSKIPSLEDRARLLADVNDLSRDAIAKSVAGVIRKGDLGSGVGSSQSSHAELSPEDQRLVDEMQRALGLKVRMSRSEQSSDKGKISIEFYSDTDLQELFRKLIG